MTLDYFYGAQADQFAFYRIPKALFTDERFKSISAEAKILYGILLDRMSLSRKNGWLDEQGRVFIIFTLEEVMEAIGCADQKAMRNMRMRSNSARRPSGHLTNCFPLTLPVRLPVHTRSSFPP